MSRHGEAKRLMLLWVFLCCCCLPVKSGAATNSDAVAVTAAAGEAGEAGEAVECVCAPTWYEIQLNFSLTCNDSTLLGLGIDPDHTCSTSGSGGYAASRTSFAGSVAMGLVPVEVSMVSIMEVDSKVRVLQEVDIIKKGENGEPTVFLDGDTLEFDSLMNDASFTSSAGLIVFMTGVNAAGMDVTNSFSFFYTNECGVIPTVEGKQIGWSVFVQTYRRIHQRFCPLVE